ncbi:type VI secretion system contractile sheath small subunit [Thiohalorhabdus methylotrophus]|uniref:Type VI secretion system contractile sheath small subunit n=1 Tax=Thiohalorhabdus methylotrophus TaxID=3242694 RepID=A0ABV4TUK1_9GAMM
MAKPTQGSVAPKERVNIVYKPATGEATERVELPLRALVLGDFTKRADDRSIEEREPVQVGPDNFDEVMESMDLELSFSVPNRLTEQGQKEVEVKLNPKELADFHPDRILEAVPEMQKTLAVREALKALKGPIGNIPEVRRTIQRLLQDEETRSQLESELGIK